MTIKVGGETFSGLNKPKRTPNHPTKTHAVAVRNPTTGRPKLIRFGSKGATGSPKKAGESESHRKRRLAWKARHAANIKKGPMSAAYWANKVKW